MQVAPRVCQHTIEAARSAALAAHAAAGLADSVRQRVAARLLRAAEASCRSAAAILAECKATHVPAKIESAPTAAAMPEGARTRRNRKRSKKKKQTAAMEVETETDVKRSTGFAVYTAPAAGQSGTSEVQAHAAATQAQSSEVAAGASRQRTLAARPSRERSPRRISIEAVAEGGGQEWIAPGACAILHNLETRQDLNGQRVTLVKRLDSNRWEVKFEGGASGNVAASSLQRPTS